MITSREQMLLEEYKIVSGIGERYFERLYATINFTVVFYGAIFAAVYAVSDRPPIHIVFYYFLPIVTYILGLFYAYNSFVIARQGYFMIRLEKMLQKCDGDTSCEKSFLGWNIISRKYNGKFILPYGSALVFFILLPAFDGVYGLIENDFKVIISYTENVGWNCFFSILPLIFYIVYLIFMVLIIWDMRKMRGREKKLLDKERHGRRSCSPERNAFQGKSCKKEHIKNKRTEA